MASSSTVRTGRVSSIDYTAGTYKVTYFDRGKSVTREINAISNGEYKMPEVGQVVPVNHNSNGTAAGTTTGTIWNKSNKPAEGYKGLFRKEYASMKGKAYEKYDANTGVYTQFTDSRTGRNCKGEIYDEAAGPASFVAGGQVSLISNKASASIKAQTGIGLVAGTTITLEAGTYVSIEATSDYALSVGGDTSETHTGKTEREYMGPITDTINANVDQTLTGDLTQKIEGSVEQELKGDAKATVEGNLEQEITGDITKNITGNVTITVGGATVELDAAGNAKVNVPKLEVTAATGDVTVDGISLVHHKHKGGGADEPEK